jgi:SEC-C motif-containing protein
MSNYRKMPNPLSKPVIGQACPCGSGKNFENCCEPIIALRQPAPSAEQLMRARFTAHVAGAQEFLHRSVLETANKPFVAQPDGGSPWTRLVIHSQEAGKVPDMATVDFTAYYVAEGGVELAHDEKGEFKKHGDGWIYVRALRLGPAPVRAAHKVGRNDPCPCGSGKKYKHCCGKA